MLSTGEVEPAAIVAKLRQALTAVNDLSSERAALEEALKVEKNRDNILPRIMASSGNYDALFREEIRKYDKLKVLEPPRFDPWIGAASSTAAGILTVMSGSFCAQSLLYSVCGGQGPIGLQLATRTSLHPFPAG